MSKLADPNDEGLTNKAKCLFSLKERLEQLSHHYTAKADRFRQRDVQIRHELVVNELKNGNP